jgi:hypothetical protein
VGETRPSLRKQGWNIGKQHWKNTRKYLLTHKPGEHLQQIKKRSVVESPEVLNLLAQHLYADDISSVAANRWHKKTGKPVRYFSSPKRTIHRLFCEKNLNIKISITSFHKILKKSFPEVIYNRFFLICLV